MNISTVLPTSYNCHILAISVSPMQVRVVLGGGFRISDLSNATARSAWINMQLKKVQDSFADGFNIDIEDPVANGSQEMTLLTQFVGEMYAAFKTANKNYQVRLCSL